MMTSDGISAQDWTRIEKCCVKIVEASSKNIDDSLLVSNLFKELHNLEKKYGRTPSILATMADYSEDKQIELSLLKEAYVSALEIDDDKNKTYISASLAEFYTERLEDLKKFNFWLNKLFYHLEKYSDDYARSVYESLREEFREEFL